MNKESPFETKSKIYKLENSKINISVLSKSISKSNSRITNQSEKIVTKLDESGIERKTKIITKKKNCLR